MICVSYCFMISHFWQSGFISLLLYINLRYGYCYSVYLYFPGMAQNEEFFPVDSNEDFEHKIKVLKEQLADRDLTILVLRGYISVFEKTI